MKNVITTHKTLLWIVALTISFSACSKLGDVTKMGLDDSVVLNTNLEDLSLRMHIVQEPISFTNTFKTGVTPNCSNYTWTLVADVESPLFNGEPLSATDVRIYNNKAYVTYHRQGDIYAGGIEVIDITDPEHPTIKSYMQFDGVDINSLAIDNFDLETDRRVYLAGSSFKKGAVLRQVNANDGILQPSLLDISLSDYYSDGEISASANGIALSDYYIYMTSGNTVGGTFQLDRQNLDILSHEEYSSAKGIALNGAMTGDYQVSLIGGDAGELKVHQVGTNRAQLHSWNLGELIHQNVEKPYFGKATVAMLPDENIAFIAMNKGGMKAIDILTGAVVYTSDINMLTTGNTHGIAVDASTVYLANSDDGLYIGCIPDDGGEILFSQHWDLGETGASANMVQTAGDWVFVAKGGGGLKILRKQ